MRLLDLIAQGREPPPGLPREWPFPGPRDFAAHVVACPLRLVLADELTTCATLLAYAEGRRLSGCLDLLHVPSQQLWVEWAEAPRAAALGQVPQLSVTSTGAGRRRAGVLVSSDAAGRTGSLRTFWSDREDHAYCAAMITDFDLDRAIRPALDVPGVFRGDGIGVCLPEEPTVDALLEHVRFRLDAAWAGYYRSGGLTAPQQHQVLRHALGTTAFDIPMLFALFLLFMARDGLVLRPASVARLNESRRRSGKPALIEHVEVRTSLLAPVHVREPGADRLHRRHGPRLHHVRGHIARRGNKVFWRTPHLRGNARLGILRSRTVQLEMR